MEDTTTNELEELLNPEEEKLFKIAYWSKSVSWVILIIGALEFIFEIGRIYFGETLSISPGVADIGSIISWLFIIFSRVYPLVFYFLVLQGVGELLYLAIDIKEQLFIEED